jgi:heme-degrading monooxygenase HmoA
LTGAPLVAVTDHACERFRQRVGSRTGAVDVRTEIAGRVARAVEAGRSSDVAPAGASGARGSVYVRDLVDRGVVFVCRPEGRELVVVTLWEDDDAAPGGARVPRRFTDALKSDDHSVSERADRDRP